MLTGLVLNNQLELLHVLTIGVAGRSSEGKVRCQARIGFDDIRGRVSRTGVGVSIARLQEASDVLWCATVWVRCRKGDTHTRSQHKE